MTEIFDELAVSRAHLRRGDKVVYLLTGLPESYDKLVTALESIGQKLCHPWKA